VDRAALEGICNAIVATAAEKFIDLAFDDGGNSNIIGDIQHKQEKLKKELNKVKQF